MLKIMIAAILVLVSAAAVAGSEDGSRDQKLTCEEQLGPNAVRFPGVFRAPITLSLTAEQEANPYANVVEIFGSIRPYKTFFIDGTHGNDPYFPKIDFNKFRLVQLTRPIYSNPLAGRWMAIPKNKLSDGLLFTSLLELQDIINSPSVGVSIEVRQRALALALKSNFGLDFRSAKLLANDFYELGDRAPKFSRVDNLAHLLTLHLETYDIFIEIYDENGVQKLF